MSRHQVIEADYTWLDGKFVAGVQITIDDSGRIAEVGIQGVAVDRRLRGQAVLPGFVNAHSHAFQRGLRGLGESFPGKAGNFWSWREAMYKLVETLDQELLYTLCRRAFDEMRAAGITAVGEFHYLHHLQIEQRDFAFDAVVLRAARDCGIRLVLLEAYYRTGGIGQPLTGGQRRFAVTSPKEYWHQIDRLAAQIDGPLQSLGAVAHSIRSVDRGEMAELHAEALRREMVFHAHLEEQRPEIDACREAYNAGPLAIISNDLEPGPEFTAVHCTHSTPEDLQAFLANGANICICPLTEGNLGDGIANLPVMLEHGGAICLGTDSNARISMTEELRWLEYVQRLAGERRGVMTTPGGDCAARLLAAATSAGARSLGLAAGAIETGLWADLVAIDLAHPTLAGWTADSLAASLILGGGDGAIAATCIGGDWRTTAELYQPQL